MNSNLEDQNPRLVEELLKELLEKMEDIKQNQELILARLDDSILYPKHKQQDSSKKKKTRKELEREQIEEYKLLLIHGPQIRAKFNLVAAPHPPKILAYLKTGDASIFDGLKRKE